MTAAAVETKKWTFKDGKDPEDPQYRKSLQTPASIKMDLTLVKDKKRVETILQSSTFREELEEVIDAHLRSSDYPGISTSFLSLQHIVDLFSPAPGKKPASGGGLTKTQRLNVIPINDLRSGANNFYSRNERLLRCKLASVFRLLDLFSWNTSSNTHVTARVSREKEHFLINPFGLLFHEITASSLLKIDTRGNVIDEGSTVLGLKQDSWKLNAFVHSARPDIRVVSVMSTKLLPLSKEAMILGPISYFDPSEMTSQSESVERAAVSEALGPTAKVMFIKSMGLFAMGETIDEAWHYATNAMVACETQLTLSSLGLENLVIPSQEVCQRTYDSWRSAELGGLSRREAAMEMRVTHAAEQKRKRLQQQAKGKKAASAEPSSTSATIGPTPWRLGELEFEAMMRHLDNAGYRTGHLYRFATLNSDLLPAVSATRPSSRDTSPRVHSPTPLATTKGRRSRAHSPAG
ncbi:Alpha-adducin, partial [Cichlidogyrus casuarinus]